MSIVRDRMKSCAHVVDSNFHLDHATSFFDFSTPISVIGSGASENQYILKPWLSVIYYWVAASLPRSLGQWHNTRLMKFHVSTYIATAVRLEMSRTPVWLLDGR
jgi:hypothetical protein